MRFILGKAGSGKSSAMAKLALDWADDDRPPSGTDQGGHLQNDEISNTTKLKQFDFVFLIELKHVDSDVSLETVITEQHEFDNNDIAEDQINAILKNSKTLLIFDGYDEYKKGTNSAIDAAVSGKRGNSFIIITSRPDYMEKKDRNKLDEQIQIWGLSHKSIRECTKRYLDSEAKSHDLCKKAKDSGIFDLLRTPIILLMMCVLYIENEKLPESKVDAVWKLVHMYIERAKEKGIEFEDNEKMLLTLGELSWNALLRDTHQLLINKVSYFIVELFFCSVSKRRMLLHINKFNMFLELSIKCIYVVFRSKREGNVHIEGKTGNSRPRSVVSLNIKVSSTFCRKM